MKYYPSKENPDYLRITLMVLRRPKKSLENQRGDIKTDGVIVYVRNKEQLKYIMQQNAESGDFMEVEGVYCTVPGIKKFICSECGEINQYQGMVCFVHPLTLRVIELKPKKTEIIEISSEELDLVDDEDPKIRKSNFLRLIREKKKTLGEILSANALGSSGGNYWEYKITVREKITDEETIRWLEWMSEISNRILIMGHLCNDPDLYETTKGSKLCSYQLGTNRKAYIKEDDPSIVADFPWVRSMDEQAQQDFDVLKKGSLVYIDGAIQAREGVEVVRECIECGAENKVKDYPMEIVPYSVEYLRNCDLPEGDDPDDDYPWLPEEEETEED